MAKDKFITGDSLVLGFSSRPALAIPVIGILYQLFPNEEEKKRKSGQLPVVTADEAGATFHVYDPSVINLEFSIDPKCGAVEALAKQLGIEQVDVDAFRFVVPLQVEFATYQVFWSAGVGFLGLRDQRYRLDSIADNPSEKALVRLNDGGINYNLLVLAHYCDVSTRAVCWSFGLGTDVPSSGLTAALGLSGRMRVLPITDSMYLTAGAAYGPHSVINADFQGRSTVPAATTTSSLFEKRYDIKWFAGVSFGFLGGKEDFTGLYKGKAQSGGK